MVFYYLLTVPLQVQMVTVYSKPIQSESVFASPLCWLACFYEHRVIFRVDGLITVEFPAAKF